MLSNILKKKQETENESNDNNQEEQKSDDTYNQPQQSKVWYKEEVTLEECDSKAEKAAIKAKESSQYDKTVGIFPDPDKIETTMAKSKRTKTPVQHVVHDVNWSGIFDESLVINTTKWKYNPKAHGEVEKGKDAWTIEIFSPAECAKLVELCEIYGFEDCGYPKSYRSNTRLITNDQAFADKLYERIKECCPPTYKSDGVEWEICGLNERFRWCKYVKGQRFFRHCDARFSRKATEKSFYTVNVYLNDGKKEFEGGRTRFFNPHKKTGKWEVSVGVVATPGLSLMFNQYPDRIEHDGEEVTSGKKYLMRTDVMYKSNVKPENAWIHGAY